MTVRVLLSVLLALASAPAFAQDVAPAPVAGTRDAASADDRIDRTCLRSTGTRIRARAATAHGRCPTHAYGRVYTQDDLRATGEVDIADALRMLDPSIR